MNKEIMVQHIGQVTLVSFLCRKVTEQDEIEHFRAELQSLPDESPNKIFLLDFNAVHFMSSFVIGQLISFSRKVSQINGLVAFCAVNPPIDEIFSLTNLTRIFQFFPTQKEALEVLNSGAGEWKKGYTFF